ncbi:hypothetical protein B0H34DRAFT_663696, partial [Crassisporium funariophilum]
FPILYRFALDVIPVQASAVPCEHVFSSSKETDSNRRSVLGHELMEILQISKYLHRDERLDFTSGLLATEEECLVVNIAPSVLSDLLCTSDIAGLEELISSSYQ